MHGRFLYFSVALSFFQMSSLDVTARKLNETWSNIHQLFRFEMNIQIWIANPYILTHGAQKSLHLSWQFRKVSFSPLLCCQKNFDDLKLANVNFAEAV